MPSTKDSPPKFTNPQLDALATIWSADGQLAHVKSSSMLAEIVQREIG